MEIEELFGEVISSYTEDEAIRDGVLVHPYPSRFPRVLFSASVEKECRKEAEKAERTYDEVATPLIIDAIREVRRVVASNARASLIDLEGTVAGTIWICPNTYGGLTLMKPADH